MKLLSAFALLALVACTAAPAPDPSPREATPPPALSLEAYTFTGPKGVKVEAERGWFEAPENRNDPASRRIRIGFVRFKSTSATPGDPIVYLAGGPGGTGVGAAQ